MGRGAGTGGTAATLLNAKSGSWSKGCAPSKKGQEEGRETAMD